MHAERTVTERNNQAESEPNTSVPEAKPEPEEPEEQDCERYAEEFKAARDQLILAQSTIFLDLPEMTRDEVTAAIKGIVPLKRIRKFSSLIDASLTITSRARQHPGRTANMKPALEKFRKIVDKVWRAEEKAGKRKKQCEAPADPPENDVVD